MGGQWAEQQKAGMKKQEQAQQSAERHHDLSVEEQRTLEEDVVRETQEGGSGDDRTPDKPIDQVAYADGQKRLDGGAEEPQTSPMEPENQGGIGGP
jgi:hypothetical protein